MLPSRTSIAKVTTIAVSSAALLGCNNANRDEAIFQEPAHQAPALSAPSAADTTLTAVANIPYRVLEAALKEKTSSPMQFGDSQQLQCAQVPYVIGPHLTTTQQCAQVPYVDFRGVGTQKQCAQVPTMTGPSIGTKQQCVSVNWHATAQTEGEPVIARAGDAIRASLPISITGQAGLSGDLAEVLSLSAKNFEAHVVPGGDLRATVDGNWCPHIDMTPADNWVTDAKVEVVGQNCVGIDLGPLGHPQICAGPANVDLTGPANSVIEQQHDKIHDVVATLFSCNSVRAAAQSRWVPVSLPITVSGDQKLFLNLTPTAASVSSLIAENDTARIVLQVSAQTTLGAAPLPATPIQLPMLGQANPSAESNLNVHLQAVAPYKLLTDLLASETVGVTFSDDTATSAASLRVEEVTVYPSDKSLVVGVRIMANVPGRIFNTHGWVYLLGDPTPGDDGASIRIDNFRYALVLDNKLWNAIAVVFDKRIRTVLRDHSSFDLTQIIKNVRENVLRSVTSASIQGMTINVPSVDIRLDSVALGPEGFVANATAHMPFSIEINSLPS